MSNRMTLRRTLVMYFLAAACLPLMLAGITFVQIFSKNLEKEIRERNTLVAKAMTGEVNRFLMDYRAILEYAADRMTREPPLGPLPNERLEWMVHRYNLFESVKVLNRESQIQTLAPFRMELAGLDMSGHSFIQQAISSGQSAWSDVYLSSRTGEPSISLAIPFAGGVVAGDMNLTVLQQIIEKVQIGSGGYAAMTDAMGATIAHPERKLVVQRQNVKNLELVQRGLAGEEGTFRYRVRDQERIGSVARVPETGWLVVVVQPEREAFAAVHRVKLIFWASLAGIALFTGILAGYFLQRTMSPLIRLTGLARQISDGNYCVEEMPESYPEIDQLFGAFASMSEAVSQRETALRESRERAGTSEKRLREIHDAVTDLIYTHDLDGRILSANRAMTELLGHDPAEIIGHIPTEAMKPEMRPFFGSHYLETIQARGRQEGVFICFSRDGRKLYIEYASTLLVNESGQSIISGVGTNVTDRILAERAIREKEARIHAILEAMPTPLAAYDTKGGLQFINSAFTQVFGWTQDELRNGNIEFVPESEKKKTRDKIRELYQTGIPGVLETQRFTKDGRLLDILSSAALIRGDSGKSVGMVVCLTDLTEKKKMEANLLHVQKMEAIGVLAGGIAHDFNNLLMAIQGNVSLMMMDMAPNSTLYQRLRDMERYTGQGAGLTRQLLGFAKGGKYEVRATDLNRLIQEHDQVFSRTRKDIRIEESLEEKLWPVAADQGQMEQVLMNLYINAAQSMPKGGTITVSSENLLLENDRDARIYGMGSGKYVHVSVADTGTGMDESVRRRIFEPFFSTKKRGRGTGLGLASVYGIIRNHGGFIDVESTVGKGTRFHIFIPATQTAEPVRDPVDLPVENPVKREGLILLIDDEEMIRDVGSEMLERLGYRVLVAGSGREALRIFEQHHLKIVLVVLDMIMPEMGGDVVFERLKDIDPNVAVLLSSGYSIDGQAQEILNRGCKGFLQKPFNLNELIRAIDTILVSTSSTFSLRSL